jgi:RNA polymerase sigma factor (sigma-70 family)
MASTILKSAQLEEDFPIAGSRGSLVMSDTTIELIQACLVRLGQGDVRARAELINLSCARLTLLTRRMLKSDDRLVDWEQTADIRQNAVLRLWRSLERVTPGSVDEFFGLAATQIRRELIDLARHYFGDRGMGKNTCPTGQEDGPAAVEASDATIDPIQLAAWTEFHRQVETLDPEERQLVEFLWYLGLPQHEVATLLGVDVSTVKRRWRALRLKLSKVLKGWSAED